ncbi:FCH and double SH3 domains 2 (predicted), isoform CRA_c [Rattus norvegicus]|uniref:FCH and double SH3 domains 2 (Predicted), isoform CRA_c n=1 Tax=Rattus norvegicus TaxID=10116 RepID=A6I6S7_RAT|nr:FCH and double SH3 domains 2 (predicted), isoform CRA_c [Rattus norvegicus]
MTKLQAKHQAECDLLEDMRTFSQKKAAIEREYAQGIQKLASQYLKRDWPGIKTDDRNDYRSMYPVWKSFLEATMQVAQSRINICENYKNFISEPARAVRSLTMCGSVDKDPNRITRNCERFSERQKEVL